MGRAVVGQMPSKEISQQACYVFNCGRARQPGWFEFLDNFGNRSNRSCQHRPACRQGLDRNKSKTLQFRGWEYKRVACRVGQGQLLVVNPSYLAPLVTMQAGRIMIALTIVMIAVGTWVLRKIGTVEP